MLHALFLQVHMWEKGFFIITRSLWSKQNLLERELLPGKQYEAEKAMKAHLYS